MRLSLPTLLLCAAGAAVTVTNADGSDFPLLWDIGGAGLSGLDVPDLIRATPRVQLHRILECPHPCGLLPSLGCDPATAEYGCNGALPQPGAGFNLTLHLDTLRRTFDVGNATHKAVPDDDDRWIDLDYEEWGPLWNHTSADYQNASIELVRRAHPHWTTAQLINQATVDWEAAAMQVLVETIRFVRKIRPKLKVGMYSYPLREYWHGYNSSAVSESLVKPRSNGGASP
jgi:hypothetical protein